jgi:hypothetical protein
MKEAKSQQATAGFNAATGTSSEGYSRGKDTLAKNQWSGHSNDGREVNFGRGPTGGSTKVPNRGQETFKGTAQVRTPGGTRAFEPKAGQNYKGNADSINVGRGPTKGNQL